MAISKDDETLKKAFLEYMKNKPVEPLDLGSSMYTPPKFDGGSVKKEWIGEARRTRMSFEPDIAIRRSESIARIVSVEPKKQGKTLGFLNALREEIKGVTKTSHKFEETIRKLSDVQNAISKSLLTKSEKDFAKVYQGVFETEKVMSKIYPIKSETVSLNHKGGTKSYHLTMVSAQNGNSLVIYRWGKTGEFGQTKIETFETESGAEKAFEKKLKAKMGGGYHPDTRHDPKPKTANSFQQLRGNLGRPLTSALGPDHIRHLDPDQNVKGIRAAEEPRIGEDGRLNPIAEAVKKRQLEAQKRLAKEKIARHEDQKAREEYAKNPNWGAF